MVKAMEKIRSRDPEETWIILHAITVDINATIMRIVSDLLIKILNRMRKH